MPQTFSRETNGKLDTAGLSLLDGRTYRAKVKSIRATIDYDGQASGDTIVLGELPVGATFLYGVLIASATAGASATIAIGTAAAAGKYRTAATFTAANTPTMFGNAAAVDDDLLAAAERVIATVGTAALPNSADFLIVELFYADAS
ncbi:hypothetical protein GV829_04635 [Sphingomonas lacunae]|uniref:Uncharacterized protein n=1 Tax=Sphingomonas lacunae TaxID=2698828 RepID=A0A6M4AU04_9SPHN|nr:hypothetical protein [Sphingomonas lacunae]QJQ31822.1 hypothetical protein GV829_04635 [Sphingomonas lacunae]